MPKLVFNFKSKDTKIIKILLNFEIPSEPKKVFYDL